MLPAVGWVMPGRGFKTVGRNVGRRTRNVDAPGLLETFLVSAVVSFLSIRGFLALTGYPRLGGSGLHIAHMLWGGLLMLVALGMLLVFLDRSIQWLAAIVAGLGFGTFIDEIGKFLTSDNNYFFRPAVALIYVVFVAVFLVGRAAVGRRSLSAREHLGNALALLAAHVDRPIQPDDRARILALLDGLPDTSAARADAGDTSTSPAAGVGDVDLADDLRRYVEALPTAPDRWASIEALPSRLARAYSHLASREWFDPALIVGVLAYTAAAVVGVVTVLLATERSAPGQTGVVARIGEAGATLVGVALVLRAIPALHTSRAAAYHWMLRGLLVWILIAQVFVFYASQLAGLGGLAVDLVAYASLRFALAREERPRSARAGTAMGYESSTVGREPPATPGPDPRSGSGRGSP